MQAVPSAHLLVGAKRIDDTGFGGAGPQRATSGSNNSSTPSGSMGWLKWAPMTAAASADTVPAAAPDLKPGLLAPRWEKKLHRALVERPDIDELVRVGAEFEQAEPLASLFDALWRAIPAGNLSRAIDLLSWLYNIGYDPSQDKFVRTYLPKTGVSLSLAYGVDVQLPLDRNYIGLLLAELYQSFGDVRAARQVLEQLTPSTITAVPLTEFYLNHGWWPEVVALTDNLNVEDEASVFLLVQRGIALREQGRCDASRAAFTRALEVLEPTTNFGQRVLVERGLTYLREGKVVQGRTELRKVLAANSGYPGLRNYVARFAS